MVEFQAWCSTEVDDDGHHVGGKGRWGNCGQGCPIPPDDRAPHEKGKKIDAILFLWVSDTILTINFKYDTIDIGRQHILLIIYYVLTLLFVF